LAQISENDQNNQLFHDLKALLAKNKCRIVYEDVPKQVTVIQGSLWGTSPKTAQKKVTFTLTQDHEGTEITSNSRLTSSYINFALVGCVFSVALLLVLGWIALDLQSYAVNGLGFWSWLAQTGGQYNPDKAAVFIQMSWILAAFLACSIVVEAFIILKVRSGIEVFAKEVIRMLQK
jgi:hypothetical protein